MESIGVVHISQIVENVERQVDVDLVERAGLLTERANLFLLGCRLFCLLQGLIHVLGDFGRGGLLKKSVNLFFKLFEMLLLALILLLLNVGLVSVSSGDSFWNGLAFEAGGGVRLHCGAEALGSAWDGRSTGAHTLVG